MVKAILVRLEALEKHKPEFFTLTYADGHTERTRDLNAVIDMVFTEQDNGLIKVSDPRGVNNLFQVLLDSIR